MTNVCFITGVVDKEVIEIVTDKQEKLAFVIVKNFTYLGNKVDVTTIKVSAYGKQATYCVNELSVGDDVYIEGRVRGVNRRQQDGSFRYSLEIRAKIITRLDVANYK